jgi:alpha-tubulin suppressor-like RCC1 family protein
VCDACRLHNEYIRYIQDIYCCHTLVGQCGSRLERCTISAPSIVEGLKQRRARAIACGAYHSLVIAARSAPSAAPAQEDTAVYAFGWNNYGQLGFATGKKS